MSSGQSKTGLQAATTIPVHPSYLRKLNEPSLRPLAGPAPVVLRPFAGIYNPFPYGCSVLCNHPSDLLDVRDHRNKAACWVGDGGATKEFKHGRASFHITEDWVPEELFRKYTETDSRPTTPAPTMTSNTTKASHRRCVTPDPAARERTVLVLDLRRSHSQETLSWRGMVAQVPLLPPPSPAPRWKVTPERRPQPRRISPPSRCHSRRAAVKTARPQTPEEKKSGHEEQSEGGGSDPQGSPQTPRRRGLRRRGRRSKKLRDDAGSPEKQEFKGLDDPGETQISTLESGDIVEVTPIPCESPRDINERKMTTCLPRGNEERQHVSFLQEDILHRLQRHLDWEQVEAEFDLKRRTALEEAMRAPRKLLAHDMLTEDDGYTSRPELWVAVPRAFTRRSARFELPIDSRILDDICPLDYLSEHVYICEARRVLYNCIFNRHRVDSGIEGESRTIQIKNMPGAFAELMGQCLNSGELLLLGTILCLDWTETREVNFRMFCGSSAACERVLGCSRGLLPSINEDPPHQLETADLESLASRIANLSSSSKLFALLNSLHISSQ